MTPENFKTARINLGLSQWQLATLLGLTGAKHTRRRKIEDFETGQQPISGPVSRLITAYLEGYRPAEWEDVVSGKLRPTTEHEFVR